MSLLYTTKQGPITENTPKSESGIHIDPKNKGKFTSTKKRTGKSTEELTHSKNPLTRKRAIFAQNAKKFDHSGRKASKHQTGGTFTWPKRETALIKRDGTAIDKPNLKLKNNLVLRELSREASDKNKLFTTGRIDNPQSIAYKNRQPKQQPTISQETRSLEEMNRVKKAVQDAKGDNRVSSLPLIYANSPEKAVGDVLSLVDANDSMKFPTSDYDRQALAYNANNPYKTKIEKVNFALSKGLELVPGAATNVLLAAQGKGASGLMRTINNAVNPLAGSGTSMIRARDAVRRGVRGRLTVPSAVQETKRIGEAAAVGGTKNELKEGIVDRTNSAFSKSAQWERFRKKVQLKERPTVVDNAWMKYSIPAARQDLPKSLEPYISRRVATPSREQEIFENSFGPAGQAAEIAKRTTHYDRAGNIIPAPEGFGVLQTSTLVYDPKRGLFRKGGVLIRYE